MTRAGGRRSLFVVMLVTVPCPAVFLFCNGLLPVSALVLELVNFISVGRSLFLALSVDPRREKRQPDARGHRRSGACIHRASRRCVDCIARPGLTTPIRWAAFIRPPVSPHRPSQVSV